MRMRVRLSRGEYSNLHYYYSNGAGTEGQRRGASRQAPRIIQFLHVERDSTYVDRRTAHAVRCWIRVYMEETTAL